MLVTGEIGDAKGRAVFVAIATGWMAVAAIGLLISAVSVFIHLIGLADFSGPHSLRQRGVDTWVQEYGWELALLGLIVNGATLACAIGFYRRRAWARVPFQASLVLQIAEFVIAAVVQVQSTTAFMDEIQREGQLPEYVGPVMMSFTMGIGLTTLLGKLILAVVSVFALGSQRMREHLEPSP